MERLARRVRRPRHRLLHDGGRAARRRARPADEPLQQRPRGLLHGPGRRHRRRRDPRAGPRRRHAQRGLPRESPRALARAVRRRHVPARADRRTGGAMRCRNGEPYGIAHPDPGARRSPGRPAGHLPTQNPADPEQRAWLCLDTTGFAACTTHLDAANATVARAQCDYLLGTVLPRCGPPRCWAATSTCARASAGLPGHGRPAHRRRRLPERRGERARSPSRRSADRHAGDDRPPGPAGHAGSCGRPPPPTSCSA